MSNNIGTTQPSPVSIGGRKIFRIPAALATDFYKTGHRSQYPRGTQEVFANFTARSSKIAMASKRVLADYDQKVLVVGTQPAVMSIINQWDETFFDVPKHEACQTYKSLMDISLGLDFVQVDHLELLHDIGYLPLEIRSLDEGTRCPIRVPFVTVRNTRPDMGWLTNYIETDLSDELWPIVTNATQAFEYRRMLEKYAKMTGGSKAFVKWQGHDFSARGMMGRMAAAMQGIGHLSCFFGTDTVAAMAAVAFYYGHDLYKDFIGGSVPATEHSVMCAGGQTDELSTFKRIITEVCPTGVVSVVSDTWDLWDVVAPRTGILAQLKTEILNRGFDANGNSKVVVRPDSGDPVDIMIGEEGASRQEAADGVITCLEKEFGTMPGLSPAGYRSLCNRVGAIYGDSITLTRGDSIMQGIANKGMTTDCAVLGIGSYTYQYVTRDLFGMAMKTTACLYNGNEVELFKDPVTDIGNTKRSAKGYLRVGRDARGELTLIDQISRAEALGTADNELKVRYRDGEFFNPVDFNVVRGRIDALVA